MKYLIIPDVHNRIAIVEKIIASVKPDKTIFLGDYFDDFHDTPDIAREVVKWFRQSIHNPDRIHLCGNHDVHYWFEDNAKTRCSGYSEFKSMAIRDIVTTKEWQKLEFFYVLDNKWLLSHAGVHPSWIDDKFKSLVISSAKLSDVVEKLNYDTRTAINYLYAKYDHWFIKAGFSRSLLSHNYGGLLWCDWTQEFMPIRGIHQIVGHTPQRHIKWIVAPEDAKKYKVLSMDDEIVKNPVLSDKNSFNICLDTYPGSKYYAIYEDGKLTIHESKDLK